MERLVYKRKNSEEVEDIISKEPKWILRFGIGAILAIFLLIIGFSALIKYPDLIKTTLVINSINSPKSVISRHAGKISTILIKENQFVAVGQHLAYLESLANPEDIFTISKNLRELQYKLIHKEVNDMFFLPENLTLGEVQVSYQSLFQEYLQFKATQEGGYFVKKRALLLKDLALGKSIGDEITNQKKIEKLEADNRQKRYEAYKSLFSGKVISRSEFLDEENKYLASKYPEQNSKRNILDNSGAQNSILKTLADLDYTIFEERFKFLQALNQCISTIDAWELTYVLKAPIAGKVAFSGIIEQNQNVNVNQEIFLINPGNENFFGMANVSQHNMGEIHPGQEVIIKLHSFPFERFGVITGRLTKISDIAVKDSLFLAKIDSLKYRKKRIGEDIVLKNGMTADAEIITEDASLLNRLSRDIFSMLKNR